MKYTLSVLLLAIILISANGFRLNEGLLQTQLQGGVIDAADQYRRCLNSCARSYHDSPEEIAAAAGSKGIYSMGAAAFCTKICTEDRHKFGR